MRGAHYTYNPILALLKHNLVDIVVISHGKYDGQSLINLWYDTKKENKQVQSNSSRQ